MGQPLFQEPDGPFRRGQRLPGGAPFDVGQQDRRVAGPVDVIDKEVIDPVGHDAGIGAEQKPVGDHDLKVREHPRARVGGTPPRFFAPPFSEHPR